ncbi:hypothetical protein [uncultured Pedobacter sp.]|uniref:hypothetical protein n=1 Tax=uncultured Pedobacter sp. TaxID=246139 RepID=UPI0025DE7AE0|nr:hypothetical protein [uncultured Pedobacter sp.]
MSEETTTKQEMPEQLSDILLVLDKEKMKIQAVKKSVNHLHIKQYLATNNTYVTATKLQT